MPRRRNPGGETAIVAVLALTAGAAIGAAIYYATHPRVIAQPGGPVTSLTQKYTYTLVAEVPSGITDPATLMQSLASAGWNDVSILYFGPTNLGAVPQGLTADSGAYIAVGTWSGVNGAAIPQGVTVYSGDFTPPGATPVATNVSGGATA